MGKLFLELFTDFIVHIFSKQMIKFWSLMLSTLGKIFSRQQFEIFFLFFPENSFWHFMRVQLLCAEHNSACQWDLVIDKAKHPTSAAKWQQWSDRSAMSSRQTLSPPDPVSYLRALALSIWTSSWRREGSAGMDVECLKMQSRQPLTYRLLESVDLSGPRWHRSSWQRGIAESGSSRLSIDPHDRHTWRSGVRSAMHAASQLPGRGPTDVDVASVPAR